MSRWIVQCIHHIQASRSSSATRMAAEILHGMFDAAYLASYLARDIQLVDDVNSHRHLRSATGTSLIIPPTQRSTLGDRAFTVAAAREWNSLPSSFIRAPSLNTFKHSLKTHLFSRSFPLLSPCVVVFMLLTVQSALEALLVLYVTLIFSFLHYITLLLLGPQK